MTVQVHDQYVDLEAGMHVIEIRDGKTAEIVQIALKNLSCPACGVSYPKNLEGLDPTAMVAALIEERNAGRTAMLAYAQKHGLKVK